MGWKILLVICIGAPVFYALFISMRADFKMIDEMSKRRRELIDKFFKIIKSNKNE